MLKVQSPHVHDEYDSVGMKGLTFTGLVLSDFCITRARMPTIKSAHAEEALVISSAIMLPFDDYKSDWY